MSFLLKVWLAILVGPILLWLGAFVLAAIIAHAPEISDGSGVFFALGIGVLALAFWPKRKKPVAPPPLPPSMPSSSLPPPLPPSARRNS